VLVELGGGDVHADVGAARVTSSDLWMLGANPPTGVASSPNFFVVVYLGAHLHSLGGPGRGSGTPASLACCPRSLITLKAGRVMSI
jgi:hypothetical protein